MARRNSQVCVINRYRAKAGREETLLDALRQRWSTLSRRHLVSDVPPLLYSGRDEFDAPLVVEIFTWSDREAMDAAADFRDVAALDQRIASCVEPRGGERESDAVEVEPVEGPEQEWPSLSP